MLVQVELTTREETIHQKQLNYTAGRLVAVIVYCFNMVI